jgi:glycosyltransferase involved in cell wall biosynthesis
MMNNVDPMSQPLVSICLPNRNTLPYLPERVDTIFGQTYKNWELIVSDNFSEDGAWAFFEGLARKDSRVSIAQAPLGIYDGWNDCIQRARGKYIYIATSDDTMAPECLEKLVAALEGSPECDLAHCKLRLLDEKGRHYDDPWSRERLFALSSGQLADLPHVRMAPFDGLLHLSGFTVNISITQLLIRRDLFEKIGLFESRWGSVGDFNWNMRAGLVANTVHVPDTWGGWRIHGGQVTSNVDYYSIEHERKIQAMIDHATEATKSLTGQAIFQRLQGKWLTSALRLRHFLNGVREHRDSKVARRLFILRELLRGESAASAHIGARATKRPIWPETVKNWMLQIGMKTTLVPL